MNGVGVQVARAPLLAVAGRQVPARRPLRDRGSRRRDPAGSLAAETISAVTSYGRPSGGTRYSPMITCHRPGSGSPGR